MRRKKCLILLLLCLLLGAGKVWAAEDEKGWVPDDPFYTEHAEECIALDREYRANGPNGQVILYESPASSQVIHTMENGDIVLIDYVFTNDKNVEWGFCEFEGKYGWIPMPYMVLVYDGISFAEEYADQIQDEKGKVDNDSYFFSSDCGISFWTYPGSERKYTVVVDRWGVSMPEYKKTFVDEDGRKWGYVTYFLGDHLNRWICLSSLDEMLAEYEELYPDGNGPQRDKSVVEAYAGEEIFPDDYEEVQKTEKWNKTAVTVGVVAAVVVFILFYWILWKKIKRV